MKIKDIQHLINLLNKEIRIHDKACLKNGVKDYEYLVEAEIKPILRDINELIKENKKNKKK